MSSAIPTLVISLERRFARREPFEQRWRAYHPPWLAEQFEWFNAIACKERPNVGCLLSHYRCLKLAVEREWPLVCILEDDAYFLPPAAAAAGDGSDSTEGSSSAKLTPDSIASIGDFIGARDATEPAITYLGISYANDARTEAHDEAYAYESTSNERVLRVTCPRYNGTHAIVYNRAAAERVIAFIERYPKRERPHEFLNASGTHAVFALRHLAADLAEHARVSPSVCRAFMVRSYHYDVFLWTVVHDMKHVYVVEPMLARFVTSTYSDIRKEFVHDELYLSDASISLQRARRKAEFSASSASSAAQSSESSESSESSNNKNDVQPS
jgi:GR25 family glycosyltransferase involved in LPS biosynthesis